MARLVHRHVVRRLWVHMRGGCWHRTLSCSVPITRLCWSQLDVRELRRGDNRWRFSSNTAASGIVCACACAWMDGRTMLAQDEALCSTAKGSSCLCACAFCCQSPNVTPTPRQLSRCVRDAFSCVEVHYILHFTSLQQHHFFMIELTSTDFTSRGRQPRFTVVFIWPLQLTNFAMHVDFSRCSMQLIPRNHHPRSVRHDFSVQSFTTMHHSLARECRSGRA